MELYVFFFIRIRIKQKKAEQTDKLNKCKKNKKKERNCSDSRNHVNQPTPCSLLFNILSYRQYAQQKTQHSDACKMRSQTNRINQNAKW